MSADAYAKLVAHNNTVIQQFKTYKEAQERALTDAYGRLAALKEFCVKEREDMRAVFEQEKQSMCDAFEREKQALLLEKQSMCDAFEREKRETLALENKKQSALALDPPSSNEQVISDFMAGFFKANQNDTC